MSFPILFFSFLNFILIVHFVVTFSLLTGSVQELKQLADEIRVELFCIMSKMQKPFKASLAVVELTVAIHYIFHAAMDKILWDVGEVVRF